MFRFAHAYVGYQCGSLSLTKLSGIHWLHGIAIVTCFLLKNWFFTFATFLRDLVK